MPLPGAAGARTHMGASSSAVDSPEVNGNSTPSSPHNRTDSQRLDEIPLDDDVVATDGAGQGSGNAEGSPKKVSRRVVLGAT